MPKSTPDQDEAASDLTRIAVGLALSGAATDQATVEALGRVLARNAAAVRYLAALQEIADAPTFHPDTGVLTLQRIARAAIAHVSP